MCVCVYGRGKREGSSPSVSQRFMFYPGRGVLTITIGSLADETNTEYSVIMKLQCSRFERRFRTYGTYRVLLLEPGAWSSFLPGEENGGSVYPSSTRAGQEGERICVGPNNRRGEGYSNVLATQQPATFAR